MAFSPQDIDMLLSGAMNNYIFKFAFESRNPGCEFDIDSWMKDLDKFSSNDLMIMNADKQREIQNILGNLDQYAVKKKSSFELV
jgi:hypothetical protein